MKIKQRQTPGNREKSVVNLYNTFQQKGIGQLAINVLNHEHFDNKEPI